MLILFSGQELYPYYSYLIKTIKADGYIDNIIFRVNIAMADYILLGGRFRYGGPFFQFGGRKP